MRSLVTLWCTGAITHMCMFESKILTEILLRGETLIFTILFIKLTKYTFVMQLVILFYKLNYIEPTF